VNRTFHQAKGISGEIQPPASVSALLKATLLSLFAKGETTIENTPKCGAAEELFSFVQRSFGAITRQGGSCIVQGSGGFSDPSLPAAIENIPSAETLELIAPLFFRKGVRISGNASSITGRFRNALKKLSASGFSFEFKEQDNAFQLEIIPSSPESLECAIDHPDETMKTICLFAAMAAASGQNRIIETTPLPGETEAIAQKFGAIITVQKQGASYEESEQEHEQDHGNELERRIRRIQKQKAAESDEKSMRIITVREQPVLTAAHFTLTGGAVCAAPFLLAATLCGHSTVTVKGISSGCAPFIHVLRRMGGRLQTEKHKDSDRFDCQVSSAPLAGRRFSGELMAGIGELFPFVCVAAAYATGQTIIRDADFLRQGPMDLFTGTLKNLRTMGVKTGEIEDGIVIEGAREYDGAEFDACGHPAIAMAFSVAAIKNQGESTLVNAEAVDQYWPDFYFQFENLVRNVE